MYGVKVMWCPEMGMVKSVFWNLESVGGFQVIRPILMLAMLALSGFCSWFIEASLVCEYYRILSITDSYLE